MRSPHGKLLFLLIISGANRKDNPYIRPTRAHTRKIYGVHAIAHAPCPMQDHAPTYSHMRIGWRRHAHSRIAYHSLLRTASFSFRLLCGFHSDWRPGVLRLGFRMGFVCGGGHTVPLEKRPIKGSYGGKSGYVGYLRDRVIFVFQQLYRI